MRKHIVNIQLKSTGKCKGRLFINFLWHFTVIFTVISMLYNFMATYFNVININPVKLYPNVMAHNNNTLGISSHNKFQLL